MKYKKFMLESGVNNFLIQTLLLKKLLDRLEDVVIIIIQAMVAKENVIEINHSLVSQIYLEYLNYKQECERSLTQFEDCQRNQEGNEKACYGGTYNQTTTELVFLDYKLAQFKMYIEVANLCLKKPEIKSLDQGM